MALKNQYQHFMANCLKDWLHHKQQLCCFAVKAYKFMNQLISWSPLSKSSFFEFEPKLTEARFQSTNKKLKRIKELLRCS